MGKFIPDGIYIYIYIYIYSIMKTICPPGYHHNGFVATHALGDMMYIHPSCFCEIWALCVLWITSDHLYKYIHYINIHTHTSKHKTVVEMFLNGVYSVIITLYIYTHIITRYIYIYIYINYLKGLLYLALLDWRMK